MASKSVNHPVDPKEKDKDVDQKLRLFGIYQAFKNGKLPSNKQCDVVLNSTLNSKFLSSPPEELSDEGKVVVKDLRDVVEQVKKLILGKNEDQLLQEFSWEVRHTATQEVNKPDGVLAEKEEVPLEKDANRALEGLRALGNLLLTNGEFRKLLHDASLLLRDIAADASQEAANRVRPSEEQLAQTSKPEQPNVWHQKPEPSKKKAKAKKNKSVTVDNTGTTVSTTTTVATGSHDIGTETRTSTGPQQPEDQTAARKGKDYLAEKIPQERREQFTSRLRKVMIEIQGRSDYQQAIDTLLTLAEQYIGHTKEIAEKTAEASHEIGSTDSAKLAQTHLRTLIERFANGTSLDDFLESLNNIYRDADQDPVLKGWFKHLDSYIRKCLKEQGFALQEESKLEWDGLYDQGRFLLSERYSNHVNRIVDETKFLVDQFNQDPLNKALRDSVGKLLTDLGCREHGKIRVTKNLSRDFMDIILPAIFENIRYIPISRIEVADPMVDVVIENLVIESDNLIPNVFELDNDNYVRWGRKTIANKRDHRLMIAFSGVQADFRDVSYFIKKKHGFPSLSDMGVLDILLGGEGFSFKIMASNAKEDNQGHFFTVDDVSVKIRDLRIKVRKSRHKVLFAVFKSILHKAMRPALEKVLENRIRELFNRADAFVYQVNSDLKKQTREETAPSGNAFSRYISVVRYRLAERAKQEEGKSQAPEREVNVTATDEHLIFPDIKLPHSLAEPATHYRELATQGERWESPIFDISQAPQSTDIPRASSVTRKSHETAEGKLIEKPQTANGHTKGKDSIGANGTTHANGTTSPYRQGESIVTSTHSDTMSGSLHPGASTVVQRTVEKNKGNASGD
ncbi:hypothetical protein MPDQ_002562 [Monascus purpureus]|uniref:Uncharacterized protein n=1 Tax=Monascus purpureus TaxID=5098 RepID=A0A507QZT2_MONPU|nr:hypothetical protein MPDQ_002562 [Monascus purpureus]BDD58509.1 hypothetical protein MAP00_003782 [Monascus purpureus]